MKIVNSAIGAILGAFALGTPTTIPVLHDTPRDGGLVANQADLGAVHILFQNDLSTNASTAALLVPRSVPSDQAAHVCSILGEKLFPFDRSQHGGVGSDLVDQFNYLRYAGTIGVKDTFWLDGGSGGVAAYKPSRGSIRPHGQGEKLGVVCTHTAPPTVVSKDDPYANGDMAVLGGVERRITVRTGDYQLTGYRDRRSWRFLGIPFGDAPLGAKRFMHSTPYTGNKVLDATSYRNACVQATGPLPMGEDCLNLNIYTPSVGGKALKPVLVAIYGGGFVNGRNSVPAYDGGNLASRSDVVVVMINYRLGALGWLASDKDLPGNAGLSDQILALKWVREHIAAFGGDPDRITIGGQSAGAESVAALLASSAAKGLYHAAFLMSNPWVPWVQRAVQTKYVTPAVAASLECPSTGKAMVECLQNVADPMVFVQGDAYTNATNAITVALAKSAGSSLAMASIQPFLPTPDDLLDDQIFYLAGNGTIPNKVPILVGTTAGEGTPFVYPFMPQPLPHERAVLDKALAVLYTPEGIAKIDASGLFKLNASDDDSVRETVALAMTYNFFTCPTQRIVDLAQTSAQFPKVYLYEAESGYTDTVEMPAKCTAEGTGVEVCHSDDLMSVFGSLNYVGIAPSSQYLDFVRYTADAFSAFVRTHSPNPSSRYLRARGRSYAYTQKVQSGHAWLPFTTPLLEAGEARTQYLSAGSGIRSGGVPHREVCDFFWKSKMLSYQMLDNAM
ncbi:related to Cholinesterase precursor [Sporisorium reilianum SRZ2]|uniref:Related to Cholinesterase n=1 Tax=Sporisorium reilianum (strain SRZ2) TaxID=999809 RepID=E6ZNP7_SPORE|nr:related to Cholinesterase precursor [Sporisorium reilianum SRZ2]